MLRKIVLTTVALLMLTCTGAMAYNQNPNLNFGHTNILDAMIPPPGFYLSNYMIYYTSDDFKDGNGNSLPMSNKLDLMVYCPQLIWVSSQELPHGLKWGIQSLLPFFSFDVNSDLGIDAGSGAVGDLCIGPWIGKATPLAKDWVLHWFFEFDAYMPTGSYDQKYAINPSANYWSFEPFVSLTLQMPMGFTFSTRQHITFNTTNDEYWIGDGRDHDLEAGTLYHFNYALMKTLDFISPMLRFGVVGYYGKQLEEDQLDGQDINNSEEKFFAIGPALHYIHKGMIFSLKTYFESGVDNRPEGQMYVFRIILPF